MFMLLFCRNSVSNAIHPATRGMVTEIPKVKQVWECAGVGTTC